MDESQPSPSVPPVEKDPRSDDTGFYTVYATPSDTCTYTEAPFAP